MPIVYQNLTSLNKLIRHMPIVYQNLTSGRVLPIVILVIIPAFLILLFSLNAGNIPSFSEGNSLTIMRINILFSYVMILIYAPYRSAFSTEEYFKRRGYENTINEYRYVKKILFIAIPAFIFFTITNFMIYNNFGSVFTDYVLALVGGTYNFIFIVGQLFFIVTAGLTKIVLQTLKKDFRLYFAKGCFDIAAKKDDDIDRMRLFIMGLNSYNLYLRRYLHLEIEDLKTIYSKVSSAPETEKCKIIDSVCAGFKSNKLQPLSNLMTVLNISEPDKFLTRQSLIQNIKEGAALAAVIIPIIISLITLSGIDKLFNR